MGRKALDIVGQRFGRLTVLYRLDNPPAGPAITPTVGHANALWQCQCDCGALYPARADNLRSGRTTRCPECSKLRRVAQIKAFGVAPEPARVTVVELICTHAGEHGGFARALDQHGHVVARTHFSQRPLRIKPIVTSTKLVLRCLETCVALGLMRARTLGETTSHWIKAQEITVQLRSFMPAVNAQELWFESAAAPGGEVGTIVKVKP